jgi:hypothetical protein
VEEIFRTLVRYEVYVYILLALGLIIPVRYAWKAWRDWRTAVFGLEKEISFQDLRKYGAFVIVLLMIGLSQFCLVTFVVPYLPAATFLLTPTTNLLTPPAPTPAAGTPSAATTGTPAPPPGTIGCVPNQLIITYPAPGQEISGTIDLIGTVDLPNFGFYKYEYTAQGSQQWSVIAAGDTIRRNASLGVWNTALITPGDYQIRLVVTDNLGESLPPCVVPVRIVAPTPTP